MAWGLNRAYQTEWSDFRSAPYHLLSPEKGRTSLLSPWTRARSMLQAGWISAGELIAGEYSWFQRLGNMEALERAWLTRWQGDYSEKGLFFFSRSLTGEGWAEEKWKSVIAGFWQEDGGQAWKDECSRRGSIEQEWWRLRMWQEEIRTDAEVKLRLFEALNKKHELGGCQEMQCDRSWLVK